ncbi:MAG: hypothetical protein R8M45_10095 [Ghiorsea sp.]
MKWAVFYFDKQESEAYDKRKDAVDKACELGLLTVHAKHKALKDHAEIRKVKDDS